MHMVLRGVRRGLLVRGRRLSAPRTAAALAGAILGHARLLGGVPFTLNRKPDQRLGKKESLAEEPAYIPTHAPTCSPHAPYTPIPAPARP